AELVVVEKAAVVAQLASLVQRMEGTLRRRLGQLRDRLRMLMNRPAFQRPLTPIAQRRQQVDDLLARARYALGHQLRVHRARLEAAAGKLNALSPLDTLARGYAICQRERDGAVLRRADETAVGERVRVRLWAGALACRVEELEEGPEGAPAVLTGGHRDGR